MKKHDMSKLKVWTCMFLAFAGFVSITTAAKAGRSYLSPAALLADNQSKTLYIAQADRKSVV